VQKYIVNQKTSYLTVLVSLFLFSAVYASTDDHKGHDHSRHDISKTNHSKHDHSKHGHSGPVHELKLIKVGSSQIQTELIGKAEPGKTVELHLTISKKSSLSTIRAWIGIKSGRGSRKVLLEKEGDLEFHGKLEVPKEVKGERELWFDVTTQDGTRSKVHLELPKETDGRTDHDDHKGHNH